MATATFTLTPRDNVDNHNQIIDSKKVFRCELDSHKKACFYNMRTDKIEMIRPIDCSLYDHDLYIKGERNGIIHMLTKS